MIEVVQVDDEGTLELVTDDANAEAVFVTEALAHSDWEDTWAEAPFDHGEIRMRFDRNDQAAILRLLNAHAELSVGRVRC